MASQNRVKKAPAVPRASKSRVGQAIASTLQQLQKSKLLKKAVMASPGKPMRNATGKLVKKVRRGLGLNPKQFSRLTGFPENAIVSWERGGKITLQNLRKLHELEQLRQELAEIMQPAYISEWLNTPSEQFEGATPLQIIHGGEADRVRQLIYYIESGMPI